MKNAILKKETGKNRRDNLFVVVNETKYFLKNGKFGKGVIEKLEYSNHVEVNLTRGVVTEIYQNERLIYKIPEAKAPYNFVPLNQNEEFLHSGITPNNVYLTQDEGFYTGHIAITATNKTPVYVRGTLTPENKSKNTYTTKNGTKVQIENYKPAGKLGLPGSSVRGMIRSIVEIVSFGKFGFFNNNNLYFRSFADESRKLRDEYNSFFNNQNAIKAGLIYKEGRHYHLIPDGEYRNIPRENGGKQYFKRIQPDKYIIHSGYISGKLNDWEVTCTEDKSRQVPIPESDIQKYISDKNRSKNSINLVKEAETEKYVPCFYFSYNYNGEQHFIIGHTRHFRIPYKISISGCIVPKELTDPELIDLTESMFGSTKNPGKLFFDDLELMKGQEMEPSVLKILGSPNPTSIQLYLEQDENEIKDLYHYDSDEAIIRGNKAYWHKSNSNFWKKPGNQDNLIKDVKTGKDKQSTIVKPINEGAVFKGNLRFKNLSEIELGALLFVLKLRNNSCHKIGMGKPYGLGSLKISVDLFISDRKKRYQSLTEEWLKLTPKNEKIETLIQGFSDAVWKIENPNHVGKSLWVHPRLGQLRRILDWEKKPDDETTDYMELEDFKLRMVLPTPREIIDSIKQ